MTPEDELLAELEKADTQPPVVTNPVLTATAPPAPEPEPQVKKFNPAFWGSATIEETKIEQPEPETDNQNTGPAQPQAGTATNTQQPAPATTPLNKVKREAINTSARTAVATINLAQLTLMRPLLNWRFKKESQKRYGEHLTRCQELVMNGDTPTDAAEATRKKSFDRWLKQRDTKVLGLKFTDDEEADMESALKVYFESKNVTMSPEILLYCSLASTVGKRVIDVVMWD